jgi:dTDP-glucose 4,6-dehydratase
MAPLGSAVLISGGAGFIGQNLVALLAGQSRPRTIVVLDALTYASNPTGLEQFITNRSIDFVRGDIADRLLVQGLFEKYNFDSVMHLAAESHVDRSIDNPDAFVRTNVLGTHVLLKCALEKWQTNGTLHSSRFLHVSTDEVFGDLGDNDPAFTEMSPYRPSSPYAATKAASDHLARAYERTFGLPVIVTNCSNNYGPLQHPEKLFPLVIIHALTGKKLPIYGDGLNKRDWLFVNDHCRALVLALERGSPGASYNIGGGTEQTNATVVQKLCATIDGLFTTDQSLAARYPSCPAASGGSCESLVSYVRDRPGHDRRYAIDSSWSKRTLGYAPQETFSSGLNRTVRWYLENEAWWRRALDSEFHEWVAKNYGRHHDFAQS